MEVRFNERLQAIDRLASRLEEKTEKLARAAAEDAGFPVKITTMEIQLAVSHLRTMEQEIDWVKGGKPYGTVACIFPYDAPAIMLARLGGGALLTGNRLRFSFSSWTPRTAKLLADTARPFSALEPVLGRSNRVFGMDCVADDEVRVLFISGGSGVGEAYRRQHRAFDKVFFAGPGGMPAAVMFRDCDPQAALRFISRRAFLNGGQYCTTLKKVYVHDTHYRQVRDALVAAADDLRVGDPLDPVTDIGPIRVERTRNLINRSLEQLSRMNLLTGKVDGQWVHPLLFEAGPAEVPDLELFGPLLVLKRFTDPVQVVSDLARSRYGFLLAFFGTPPDGARKRFHENFGMVYDNPDFSFTPLRLPFGGKKASGWIMECRDDGWRERDGAFRYSSELVRDGSSQSMQRNRD